MATASASGEPVTPRADGPVPRLGKHPRRAEAGNEVLTHKGGFRCTMHMVLWSPVGAPAGVPGPRRNADECDAGWFAPVATRRRPNLRRPLGLLRYGSRCFSGGIPPGPPVALSGRWAAGRACHLRRLGVGTCGVMSQVRRPRLLLPGVNTLRGGGPPATGAPRYPGRGRADMAGQPVPWRATVPGRVLPASLGNTEPDVHYAPWPFPASKAWRVRSGRTG
jgi:hypothetical protein